MKAAALLRTILPLLMGFGLLAYIIILKYFGATMEEVSYIAMGLLLLCSWVAIFIWIKNKRRDRQKPPDLYDGTLTWTTFILQRTFDK